MKWINVLVCAGCFLTASAKSQTPVTISIAIGEQSGGATIPPDFTGLSFGMKALLPDSHGSYFFSATNKPLVVLFQNLGITHLRVGGTTVESPPETPIPDNLAIDSLFGFVKAAQLQKVIYSLRLLETNAALHYDATNAAIAKYIWDKYRDHLDSFALGGGR